MTPGPESWRGDGALPGHIVIPDDARDLEYDRLALERERAHARRKARWSRLLLTRRWHTHGISGPLVALCLFVVFLFAALLTLVVPGSGRGRPTALPLATSTVHAGLVGSLLPDEQLTSVGASAQNVASRELRPGVLLVVPPACETTAATLAACGEAVHNVATSARSYGFDTWLVGGISAKNLLGMAKVPGSDVTAYPYTEAKPLILQSFHTTQTPTAAFIDGHGIVQDVQPGVTGTMVINGALDRLNGLSS